MKKLFSAMVTAMQAQQNAVLCSIIASSGSTPRGAGAKMAVFADGTTVGTVGGGAVEFHSIQMALEVHKTRESRTKGFTLSKNQVADIGMICGGDVTVHFQFFDGKSPAHISLLTDIVTMLAQKTNAWLMTEIGDGTVLNMGIFVKGQGMLHKVSVTDDEIEALCKSRAVLTGTLYVEPLTTATTVYVFGGGHVSQELVPVIAYLDFRTIVYENREEFAQKDLFPTAHDVILGSFTDIVSNCEILEEDYIIIMTRGHNDDYDVLAQALRTKANYVGVIGSRKKVAATFKRLYADGFTQSDTARVFTPIGLSIGAETPAEIAISIGAQLIEHRAGHQ